MAEPKIFNNVVIGQFVLTGVPVKVYTNGKFLTITDVDGTTTTMTVPLGDFKF